MDEKMKKFIPLFVLLGLALVGAGIYVIVNRVGMATVNLSEGYVPAGFLLGLWQGLIIVPAFIVSLFDNTISIYQVGNAGFWYNLAFIIGISISVGGSCSKASPTSKTKCCK